MRTNIWFLKGIKKGVRTEPFPAKGPIVASEWSTRIEGSGKVPCPTDAIKGGRWVPGRCINCRLCYPSYRPTGDTDTAEVNRKSIRGGMKQFGRSFYLYAIDSGACGGCNMELQAISTPHYDASRFGIFFTNTPRHADALVVMGVHTDGMVDAIERAYEAMPSPKLILALGACTISGGIIGRSPKIAKEAVVSIPGCPPNPYTILDGIIKAKEAASK